MFFNFTFIFLNFFCTLFCITASNKLCFSYRRTSGRPICFRHDERREIWCKDVSIFIKTSLSQVNPPALVKFFLYTHPPIFERIHAFEQYEKKRSSSVLLLFFGLFEFWKIIVYNVWNIQ